MKRWFLIFISLFLATPINAVTQLNVLTSFPPDFYQTFETAFEQQYPHIDVQFRNKKTTSGIKYLQRQNNHNIDIFWASAPDAFEILNASKLLEPLKEITFNFPNTLLNYPLKEEQQHYVGFALSGYGIMFNKNYLEQHQLNIPKSWLDLTKPEYYSHLALSSPSRSGTTHLMIEMILQQYGWDRGWQVIMQLAGNVATITARSYGVPEGILQHRFGLGLVIDFFAHKIDSPNIAFEYASESRFLPASIALLKNANNRANAITFIKFVLSDAGQNLLNKPNIARLPINPQAYTDKTQAINPYLQQNNATKRKFNSSLSTQRYELVNQIFDHFITFQLKTLQRLWGKIYTLEKKYTGNSDSSIAKQNDIKRLKNSLISLPISKEISLKPAVYDSLSKNTLSAVEGYLPMPILSYKQQWLRELNDIEHTLEKL